MRKSLFIAAFVLSGSCGFALGAQSWVEPNSSLLPLLEPALLKQALPVSEIRNPLRVAQATAGDPVRLTGQTKGESAKLRANLSARIRSVVRGANALVAIDNRFLRIGDEVLQGDGENATALLPGVRVILSRIGANDLVFTIQSFDNEGSSPWQTDVVVPLPQLLRKQ